MSPKKRELSDRLVAAPWWVSGIIGIGTYFILRFAVPVLARDTIFYPLAITLSSWAPLGAALFFIGAVLAAYHSARKRRLLDANASLDKICALSWREFEELLGEAYRRQGYRVIENSGAGADGGVDLVIERGGEKRLVQCKRYRVVKVNVRVVREMYGLLTAEQARGAVIVTTGGFTRDAAEFARAKPIELIDGAQLAVMIGALRSSRQAAASVSQTGTASAAAAGAPVGERAPQPRPATAAAPTCPRCGKPLMLRQARRGERADSRFWGCSGYPACRYTQDYEG